MAATPDRVLGKEARRREWDDLEGVVVDVEITSGLRRQSPAAA